MVRVAVRVDDEPATGTRRRSGRARGARTAPFASRDAVEGNGEAGVPLAPSRRALAARVPRVLARHLGARYPQEAQKVGKKRSSCFSRRAKLASSTNTLTSPLPSSSPQNLSASRSALAGSRVRMAAPAAARAPVSLTVRAADDERLRLHNLSPLKGSRQKKTRKGRGYGAGQGGTCGFGMRGQKARSGRGTRPGFEGGQTPMYRRFPKLKGIAGGMGAGKDKFVVVNVDDIAAALASSKLDAGSDVTIESLKSAGVIKATGHYRNLPLKVLGNGDLGAGVTVHAAAYSESAKAKIEAAGGKAELVARRPKWTREAAKAAAEAKA